MTAEESGRAPNLNAINFFWAAATAGGFSRRACVFYFPLHIHRYAYIHRVQCISVLYYYIRAPETRLEGLTSVCLCRRNVEN